MTLSKIDAKTLFLTWAPPGAIWSRWAKPVLFAQMKPDFRPVSVGDPATDPVPVDLSGVPDPSAGANQNEQTAIVVNLPGEHSVAVGLMLAQRGYRPVPLYNCSTGPMPVVPVANLMSRLASGVDVLNGLHIPSDAPPAFLLDANRVKGIAPPAPGMFDNRWVVFPQDFPSGTFLRSQQITRVVLIQPDGRMDDDLAHVLGPWQQAGVMIISKNALVADVPQPITVRRPSALGLWYRANLLIAFQGRRSNAGGFGSVIPTPSSGGG